MTVPRAAPERRTFGGDDGVEFIALTEIEKLLAGPPRSSTPEALRITIPPK